MANGAADDTALHIAAAFVGRNYPIANQKSGSANMVCNHAQTFVVQVSCACFTCSSFDERVKNIDLVVAVHVLQNGGQALQAHAGVNTRCRQFVQRSVGLHVELHEHVVPDFDEAVAVFTGAARRAARNVVAMVIKNF